MVVVYLSSYKLINIAMYIFYLDIHSYIFCAYLIKDF